MCELSGGEKTRVFLAGMEIHAPSVILLDEPTNHLDTEGRKQLYEFVKRTSSTLIIVSHDRTLLNLLNTTCELQRTERYHDECFTAATRRKRERITSG